jgi:hypothetical protein
MSFLIKHIADPSWVDGEQDKMLNDSTTLQPAKMAGLCNREEARS